MDCTCNGTLHGEEECSCQSSTQETASFVCKWDWTDALQEGYLLNQTELPLQKLREGVV